MDSNLQILKYLFDVNSSINAIDFHLQHEREYKTYIENFTIQRAVERELEIIGEAINKLLKVDSTIEITYARLIIDLRNKIIHSYDNINNDVIWKIIIKDIPVLQNEITTLISKLSNNK
jgi:uncharacterized protein with HEPN domain